MGRQRKTKITCGHRLQARTCRRRESVSARKQVAKLYFLDLRCVGCTGVGKPSRDVDFLYPVGVSAGFSAESPGRKFSVIPPGSLAAMESSGRVYFWEVPSERKYSKCRMLMQLTERIASVGNRPSDGAVPADLSKYIEADKVRNISMYLPARFPCGAYDPRAGANDVPP